MISLQARLSELMSKKHMTPSDIERKTNIPTKSVASILNGNSKNPTIKTLRAISEALDITLEQMLSDELVSLDGLNQHQLQLYAKSCNALIDSLIKNNYQFPIDKISEMIKEIYNYSLDIPSGGNDYQIEQKFVDWLLRKNKHLSIKL